ncbi:MAG: 30S ribosomal protein S4 [Nitrososphaerota archaeon]
MGDPKQQRKKYRRPRMPWRADVLSAELEVMGKYGLRNKRELWKAYALLSRIRRQARDLLATPEEVRRVEEARLLSSLAKRGLVGPEGTLDDILSLTVEDILERRLQTVVFRKNLAVSPYHARQLIVHGHVLVKGRRVDVPSYWVTPEEEPYIELDGKVAAPKGQEVRQGGQG